MEPLITARADSDGQADDSAAPAITSGLRLLAAVSILHSRGFQLLRVSPGMAPSGMYWRCQVGPAELFDARGAMLSNWDKALMASYSSGDGDAYFDSDNASGVDAAGLADLLAKRFPAMVERGRGQDNDYAKWLADVLSACGQRALPILYADWELPSDDMSTIGALGLVLPLPPPVPASGVAPVPEALVRLIDGWDHAGRPPQPGMRGPRGRWIELFQRHRDYLAALPEELDREHVRAACANAAADPDAAERAFIVVMVWGYGTVGYGPWRVRRILTHNRAAARKLHTVATTVLSAGAVAAYSQLSDYSRCRLRFLGPAFGTKYLTFCGPSVQPAPLILDRLVSAWLSANVSSPFDSVSWHPETYRHYVDQMTQWSMSLGVRPDELECCIFTAEAGRREKRVL